MAALDRRRHAPQDRTRFGRGRGGWGAVESGEAARRRAEWEARRRDGGRRRGRRSRAGGPTDWQQVIRSSVGLAYNVVRSSVGLIHSSVGLVGVGRKRGAVAGPLLQVLVGDRPRVSSARRGEGHGQPDIKPSRISGGGRGRPSAVWKPSASDLRVLPMIALIDGRRQLVEDRASLVGVPQRSILLVVGVESAVSEGSHRAVGNRFLQAPECRCCPKRPMLLAILGVRQRAVDALVRWVLHDERGPLRRVARRHSELSYLVEELGGALELCSVLGVESLRREAVGLVVRADRRRTRWVGGEQPGR